MKISFSCVVYLIKRGKKRPLLEDSKVKYINASEGDKDFLTGCQIPNHQEK